MDGAILLWIQDNIRQETVTPWVLLYTSLGSFGAVWAVGATVLAVVPRTRQMGWLALLSLLFSGLVGEVIKFIVRRPRPFLQIEDLTVLGSLPHSFSFPSGHTVCAFAVAFIIWRMCRGWQRWLVMILAALMAFSRLYLGVHYPSDVLAGVVVAFWGSCFVWRYRSKIGL